MRAWPNPVRLGRNCHCVVRDTGSCVVTTASAGTQYLSTTSIMRQVWMDGLSVIGILCLSAGLTTVGCSAESTPVPATAGTSDLDASAPPGDRVGDGGANAEQGIP